MNVTTRANGNGSGQSPMMEYLREIVLDSNRDLPLHAQLRTALERLIAEHFDDESKFYSESQLISNLRVSQGTVRRALSDLATRGLLEKRQARCTIVRKQSTEAALRNLAVFLPDYSSPSVSRYLTSLNAECFDRGMRMHPSYTHRGEHLHTAYENLNFGPHEGGVVLLENSPRATVELASALAEKGYNCVVIGTQTRGTPLNFVGGCNTAMIQKGLEHLVALGHRRITLLVNEPEEKETVQERIAAFEEWTANYKKRIYPRVVHSGMQIWDEPYEEAQKAMPSVMEVAEPPTAIFAISDVGALGAIKWLQQQGYNVPEDVSVMGTGGIDMGGMTHPTLTTLVDPVREMTLGVFRLLSERRDEPQRLIFEPELLARESTAAPKK